MTTDAKANPSFSLEGKVALVTGAGQGLGRAIATRMAAHGARLGLIDLVPDALEQTVAAIEKVGGSAFGLSGDATDPASAETLVGEARSRWGAVDILVNNVGGGKFGRIWELAPEDWDDVMRLNLRPMFLFTRLVLPEMIQRGAGRVICLSSGAREGTPWTAYYTGGAAYSTAKAGVHGFIRDLALEVGEYGVTVNAIAPGPINTENVGPLLRKLDEEGLPYSATRMTPLRRLGEPDEIANAAVYLASDEAAYVTGVTLHVTGGR